MKAVTMLLALILSGCTTVTCSIQYGERNSNKADTDQTPTSNTKAGVTVPVGGGASGIINGLFSK